MTGTEGAWVPLLISAAGTAASVYGQHEAQQERRGIINKQMQRTDEAQEQTNAKIAKEGQQYAPDARAEALKAEEQAMMARQQADLGENATIVDTAGGQGAVSSDFLAAKAEKALSEGDRLTAIARELAKTRAPSTLMQKEGLRRASLNGDLSSIWGSARGGANAANLDAQGIEAPWWGQLGSVASSIAPAFGGSGGAGTNYSINPGGAPLGDSGAVTNPYWGKPPKLGGSSTSGIRFG